MSVDTHTCSLGTCFLAKLVITVDIKVLYMAVFVCCLPCIDESEYTSHYTNL